MSSHKFEFNDLFKGTRAAITGFMLLAIFLLAVSDFYYYHDYVWRQVPQREFRVAVSVLSAFIFTGLRAACAFFAIQYHREGNVSARNLSFVGNLGLAIAAAYQVPLVAKSVALGDLGIMESVTNFGHFINVVSLLMEFFLIASFAREAKIYRSYDEIQNDLDSAILPLKTKLEQTKQTAEHYKKTLDRFNKDLEQERTDNETKLKKLASLKQQGDVKIKEQGQLLEEFEEKIRILTKEKNEIQKKYNRLNSDTEMKDNEIELLRENIEQHKRLLQRPKSKLNGVPMDHRTDFEIVGK